MKTVLVCGTFDSLHPGHQDFFRQASKYGKVIAIVARDASVKKLKKHKPLQSERSRLQRVAKSQAIHKAQLGDKQDFLKPLEKIQPDIIALGFDQTTFGVEELRKQLKKRFLTPRIIRLKSFQPNKFKSSLLRNK
jgi:FAD synthetase